MTAGSSGISLPASNPGRRPVAAWLLVVCALVFAMVVLGGVTRLTHSGLSMVEWRPLTGWLPPFSEAAWQAEFDNYRRYPEYQKLNLGMSLSEFKGIYWFEFSHRLLGRLIGVVFLLPLLLFFWRGYIDRSLGWRLGGLFVLGGLQGGLGWFMVASGLVDRPDVSHYRLTAHLGLATVIYGFCLWTALDLLRPGSEAESAPRIGLKRGAYGVAALVFLMILSGGLVAGLDAGFLYNTFPLMDGRWVASEAFSTEPMWRDMLENRASVQFEHRLLALGVALAVVALWAGILAKKAQSAARRGAHVMVAALVLQVTLGIATLVKVVPVTLAAAHQAGALVLFTAVLVVAHMLTPGREQRA